MTDAISPESADSARTFVYVTYIRTTREQLWTALLEPEFTARYWNGRIVESDWQVGGQVTVRHDYDDAVDSVGAVLAFEPPRRLSYEFGGGVVTFELVAQGDVVGLTVTHDGLSEQAYRSVSGGWSFILSNLKTLLESGAPLPMPETVLGAYR